MNTPQTPPEPALLRAPLSHLIDGAWHGGGEMMDILNPSDASVLVQAPCAGIREVDAAVAAARRAFDEGSPWRRMRPAERARLLWRLADLLEANADEFAMLETLNTGKPLGVARMLDVRVSVEALRYFSGWATKLHGETRDLSLPGEWLAYTRREAIGVAGLIVPWNVPLAIAVNKIAPALAAGCTVVLKPAELTPLTAVRLGQLCLEAGVPAGVVNIVLGLGHQAGQALADHPGVDKLSFTGSTEVGRKLLAASGGNFKRLSLELGGKSPVFIFEDADLERAIPAAARGIFGNTGQVCAAGSRLFIHERVFDRVVEGIAQAARSLKVGPGLAPGTEVGPLISARQRERVMGYIASGLQEGARVVAGGQAPVGAGFFVQPTVMVGTRPDMRMVQEEIFGPVLSTFRFDDNDDLDALAALGNDTPYGLSAVVWTCDIGRAHRMAHRLKAGSVRVNTAAAMDPAMPFGGYKQSGWGRENGREGVEAFTELKSIAIALN
jgi:acyl-CoA reductase-like NAD-dependent aldehyde dehydrogenase